MSINNSKRNPDDFNKNDMVNFVVRSFGVVGMHRDDIDQ
jgi:hypothetical protein